MGCELSLKEREEVWGRAFFLAGALEGQRLEKSQTQSPQLCPWGPGRTGLLRGGSQGPGQAAFSPMALKTRQGHQSFSLLFEQHLLTSHCVPVTGLGPRG